MDDLRALASELHRAYHLQDVDAGHPIRRAHDALIAAGAERDALAEVLQLALDAIVGYRRELADSQPCDAEILLRAVLDGEPTQ